MDDLKTFCCQNPECPDYGQRGLGNLRVCFRNGPNQELDAAYKLLGGEYCAGHTFNRGSQHQLGAEAADDRLE